MGTIIICRDNAFILPNESPQLVFDHCSTWSHPLNINGSYHNFLQKTIIEMDKTVTFRERPVSALVSPTLRQSFNELVICGICKNILNTPKMLSCQHTFCFACLVADRKSRPSSNTDYKCQTCQMVAPVADFNDLPSNLHIDTLLLILDPRNATEDQFTFERSVSRSLIAR